jgi:hypothetical protein
MSSEGVFALLESVFGRGNVIEEWDVAENSQDALRKGLQYCPRIDFAIKPLNVDRNVSNNAALINQTYNRFRPLLEELAKRGLRCSRSSTNENPRCFLAIEYENKTSTKHRLGSLINVGVIGKSGLVVAENPKAYRSYERILRYLDFLQENRKLAEIQNNFTVILKTEFEEILRQRARQIPVFGGDNDNRTCH